MRTIRRAAGQAGAGLAVIVMGLIPVLAEPALAQNRIENPHFHTGVTGWDLILGGVLLWTDLVEEGGCPGSGSALVTSEVESGQHIAAISQCIPLAGEETLYLSARHQGYGTFHAVMEFYPGTDCLAGMLTSAIASQGQSATEWNGISVEASPPAGAVAVLVFLIGADSEPHGLSLDEIVLSGQEPVFLDGFDGNAGGEGAPCRW
jgi:hypothetical protein